MKVLDSIKAYFRGVIAELRKVVWPDFSTLARYFFSVVLGIGVATAFIWGVDLLFIRLLSYIVK